MNLNKAALAEEIAKRAGISKKEAEEMLAAYVDIVTTTLQGGGSVNIAGFGAFSAKTRAGRVGVNPQNPSEKIDIPPVTVPKFKAGLALKKALKSGGSATTQTPPPADEPEVTSEPAPEEPTAPEAPAEETPQM